MIAWCHKLVCPWERRVANFIWDTTRCGPTGQGEGSVFVSYPILFSNVGNKQQTQEFTICRSERWGVTLTTCQWWFIVTYQFLKMWDMCMEWTLKAPFSIVSFEIFHLTPLENDEIFIHDIKSLHFLDTWRVFRLRITIRENYHGSPPFRVFHLTNHVGNAPAIPTCRWNVWQKISFGSQFCILR